MPATDIAIDSKLFYRHAVALAATGEELYQRGWVPATSGNFSMRLGPSSAIVTASGKHKGRLAPTDFIAVDLQGRALGEGKPSAETGLHTQLYARFPEVGAVLHCHSPKATVLSRVLADTTVIHLEGYELLKAFKDVVSHQQQLRIPIFENSQDIPALAAEVDRYLAEHPDCPAYLIRGHGIYCWAENLDTCHYRLEAMDFLLDCELESLRLNKPRGT